MRWCDILFRIGVFRGVKVQPSKGLILCRLHHETQFSQLFETSVNDQHPAGQWLLNECEGPWSVRMKRPFSRREGYIAFARLADAVMMRLLLA